MTWRPVAAAATALVALLTLVSSLTPTLAARERILAAVVPGPTQSLAHVAGVVGGLALLALSRGVLHGRRRASGAAVAVLVVLAAVHVAKGLDYEEAFVALSVAGLLALGLRSARREAEPSGTLVAWLAAIAAVAAAYAVAVVGTTGGEPAEVLGAVVVALALVAGRTLVAPSRSVDGHDDGDHARAADLVARHGEDPLAPFALRADKAFFFAHGGMLAYRTLGGTAVVSGDPVGPPDRVPAILADFLAFSGERGWDVVLAAAGPAYLEAYRSLGLCTFQVGSEAVVDPREFSLDGRAVRKIRQSVSRARKRGWEVEVVPAVDLGASELAELSAAEDEWRAEHPRRAGFAMSMDRLWGAPEDRGDVYVLGRAPDGRVRSFLRFVAYRDGLSLDAMRRLGDEPNGLTEAMVVAALAHAREAGLHEVSLNFAGFAHVMAAKGALAPGQRVLRWGLGRLHGHFQLERLVSFNDKFSPVWRPRFLVYTHRTRLAVAGLRVLQAESYVPAPRLHPPAWGWSPAPVPVLGEASP